MARGTARARALGAIALCLCALPHVAPALQCAAEEDLGSLFQLPAGRSGASAGAGTALASQASPSADPALHWQAARCGDEDSSAGDIVRALDQGISLGAEFMLRAQRAEGNFKYEYKWQDGTESDDDNDVRQAGAAWALAFLHKRLRTEELSKATLRALDFFQNHSTTGVQGRFVLRYPGMEKGKLGTLCLLALAYIDYLEAQPSLEQGEITKLEQRLNWLLATIFDSRYRSRKGQMVFHADYELKGGDPYRNHSACFDGEALYALSRRGRYLRDERVADATPELLHGSCVLGEHHMDHWCAMALHELVGAEGPLRRDYLEAAVDWAREYAKHAEAKLMSSAAPAALEGLVPLYVAALRGGEMDLAERLACLLRRGARHMLGLQVGHPLAAGKGFPEGDARARGGIHGREGAASLRIDDTQHVLHALLQMRDLVLSGGRPPSPP